MGFTHDIDLNADNSERSLAKGAGLSYHPVKAIDEYDLEVWLRKLQEVVDIVEKASRKKEKVYLHCTYGKGRSPTAAMAYLVSKNWPLRAAVEFVKEKGKLVWDEGNPVPKYTTILKAYSASLPKGGHPKVSNSDSLPRVK
jgi:hypothetical protein